MAKKRRSQKPAAVQAAVSAPGQGTFFPAWAAWGAFAVWGFFLFRKYLASNPFDPAGLLVILSPSQYLGGNFFTAALFGHLASLAAAAFFLGGCAGLGRFLFVRFKPGLPLLEENTYSAALGLALFAHLVLLLALFRLLYAGPVIALLAAGLGLGSLSYKTHPPVAAAGAGLKPGFTDFLAAGLLAAALLLGLAGALSPEIFYDSLVYHLAVPNLYVIKHGFADMPYNIYSNLFLLHGMLYSAGLALYGEIVPKLINYAAGVLSVAVLIAMGRRHFNARAGLWAALIFYTVTHTMLVNWSTGTEALLTFFSLASLAALLEREPGDRALLVMGALFCGCGMAVKSTGLFFAVAAGLVLLYRRRAEPAAAFKELAIFTGIAALPVLPWLVKNYIYRHNPFFPFLTSLFGLPATSDAARVRGLMGETRQMGAFELKAWLLHPWNITMGVIPNSQYFTPLFLFMLPLLFLIPSAAEAGPALLLYFVTGWLLWSFASTMVRFLMPAYPAAALLIAGALEGRGRAGLRWTLRYVVLFSCAVGLYISLLIFYSSGRWRPLCGLISRRDYLAATQQTYPYSHYAAIEFINEKLPAGAKTLIIGDARSFYFKKDFVVGSVFDKAPVVEYSSAAASGDDLYGRLKADGVTHILLNLAGGVTLQRDYGVLNFDPRARKNFNEFWAAHVKEVYAYAEMYQGRPMNRTAVYELVPAPAQGVPAPFNYIDAVVLGGAGAK